VDPYLILAAEEGCGQRLRPDLLDLDPPAGRDPSPHVLRAAAGMLEAAARLGLAVLTPANAAYPQRLREAPLRPLVLFARGDLSLLARPGIAVVGSRTPTPYGIAATQDFVATLAGAGLVVWSGLAIGIDGEAHRAALGARGATVAVLAGGLDHIDPSVHARLAERIVLGGGLLLAEAPPGLRPRRGHFPRRNRILAGAAGAVLVVEAGLASGTMHTADFAAEAGVPVFALPGPYTSPRSRGCHALLGDGAQVAADPVDLLRRLGVELEGAGDPQRTPDEVLILRLLAPGPRPTDLVQREARLDPVAFFRALQKLQDEGCVLSLPGDLLAAARGSGASR
jgi:DNA processing protein